jgi:hypothetical protein
MTVRVLCAGIGALVAGTGGLAIARSPSGPLPCPPGPCDVRP